MRSMLPSRWLIGLIGGAGVLLIAVRLTSPPPGTLLEAALLFGAALAVMLIIDVVQSLRDWRRAPLELERRLPHAFAVGASETIGICLRNPGAVKRSGRYFELADPSLLIASMPLEFSLEPGTRSLFEVAVVPSARGAKAFTAGQIRLRSSLRLLDWNLTIGGPETRRVFPNFKRQAAFAWLAGDRRLIEMGIRAQRRRGTGTDFDQLVEYRTG